MEIQFSAEEKNKLPPVPRSSVKSGGFRRFLPISCLSVSDVRLRRDGFLCACHARIFLITRLSRNQDKYMETSCHCDNLHTAELDSATASLSS